MAPNAVRSAAFFDLDKTIIAKSSVLAFGKPFYQNGLLNRRAVLRSAYAQFVFALAGADEDQIERMRAYLTAMCASTDVAQIREIVSETLHEIIDPIVYDEAVELIGEHKAAGRDVVIVSSSGEEVVAPIGAMLGADHVVATRMVVGDDGTYTGEIELYAYGPEKAVADPAARQGARLRPERQLRLPRTSATDVPMLEAVGHPFAVNADRALRKIATERDWPLLTFSNAVPATRRGLSGLKPEHPTLTATAVGAGLAVGGLVWYANRRRVCPVRSGLNVPNDLATLARPLALVPARSSVQYGYGRGRRPWRSSPQRHPRPTETVGHPRGEHTTSR